MNILEANETPIKTSKNFNINNIKLHDIQFPQSVSKYRGLKVDGNITLEESNDIPSLKYGLGKDFQDNINSFCNSNYRVHVNDKNAKLEYILDDENTNLISSIEIISNVDSNIIIKYSSATNQSCFINSIIKLVAPYGIKINISVINMLNKNSDCFLAIENCLYENSDVKYTIIDLGGKNSIQNYFTDIIGDGANNELSSIYLGALDDLKDINYIAELKGIKSNVDIDVQGALLDNARKSFKGTIDFKKGCKKSKGNENEYCMLLSDKAKSIALPMLLCTEDDVEGNHATASGKIDEKELFYIMSRGLDKKEATKLIVKARFNNILEKITDDKLKDEIISEIDRRLG